jgi:hypothetical protein
MVVSLISISRIEGGLPCWVGPGVRVLSLAGSLRGGFASVLVEMHAALRSKSNSMINKDELRRTSNMIFEDRRRMAR